MCGKALSYARSVRGSPHEVPGRGASSSGGSTLGRRHGCFTFLTNYRVFRYANVELDSLPVAVVESDLLMQRLKPSQAMGVTGFVQGSELA